MTVKKDKAKLSRQFSDLAVYSSADKTAISVRDGVLEYLGSELEIEPADKIFTVYRSPATIANAASGMKGIPLTDEHVSLDEPAPNTGSNVESAKIIDQLDETTSSYIAIKNNISVTDAMLASLDDKRELSLGYFGNLIPHSKWDYEQIDIVPHHLAVVPAGRCGSLCSFLDRKLTLNQSEINMKKLHKSFLDAEGSVNLEQIVEVATQLPDAIRKVPIEELTKLIPAMMEIMSYAKEQGIEVEDEDMDKEKEMSDEEKQKMADMDKEKMADADKETDEEKEKKFSDAVSVKAKSFADAEVKKFSSVINKARQFVDEDFDFTDKNSNDVMRAALNTQSTEKFEDAELSVAFKLLRKSADYTKFGDHSSESALDARISKDLGE